MNLTAAAPISLDPSSEPAPLEPDLFALVARHFTSRAARTALVAAGRTVTYAELQTDMEIIARRLGASPGRYVGICLPRSTRMVAAMLAVLRSGSCYLPLDPAFPIDRLRFMVEHSRLGLIITTRTLAGLFEGSGVDVVVLEDGAGDADGALPPAASVPPEAPAYVIYTSGSTGRPKGVSIPRGAVVNFLLSMLRRPGIGADDVLCAVTTLSFDIAVLELLAPLCAGGCVVIATEEEAHDPRLLMDLLRAYRVTILQATPVTWQMLDAAGWPGDPGLTALCGGEALPPGLARDLLPRVRALWNMYGPTETTVWSTCHRVEGAAATIPVGTPIDRTTLYVLDEQLRPVPAGTEGRLYIGGAGVALGYLHEPELTARRFVPDPFSGVGRMYDTGDLARKDASGVLYVMGRSDFQVKLRGFRIELGEVEAALSMEPAIEQAVCAVRGDDPANPELVAYYVLRPGMGARDLRAHCATTLAPHMVPSRFVRLEALPRTPNGKVDRNALPVPTTPIARPEPSVHALPRSDVERTLAEIWCSVLSLPAAGIHDNFFDLGGTSLASFSVAREIHRRLGVEIGVLSIFEHPTIAALARDLEGSRADMSFVRDAQERARARRAAAAPGAFDVAIVGMAGRFPGARNLDELWTNLVEGRETVTRFPREELDPLVPARDRDDPSYVPARGVLDDADMFDAAFFDVTPNEAELMAPQLRVFLEVAWEAFENAGIVGERVPGPVGVWAGMGNNFYYLFNVLTRHDRLAVMGEIAAEIANEKDHIAPRVSHKLDLKGPSLSVHTACSTTLVVVENAYQALVSHQVDVALAGGVDIRTPQKSGQRYEEGGVFSIDGHCRPFDADATGTMFGEGAGAVVLKRLADALRDGDTIHAVIKGAAVNNDGGSKVGYLAPSVEGQGRVIAAALAIADVSPETVTMVEAHGTATPIGDPIEVEALTRVYRAYTQRRRYCALGSIKSNFGHATTAAGIAGLLKIVLSMQHHVIPATLHYRRPNPRIDFETGPFFVADRLLDWTPPRGIPRRAAVSSFGFCGTNAHAIVEEAPGAAGSSPPSRPLQLVLVSARSRPALDASAQRLAESLRGEGAVPLADRAYTTHVGRKRHEFRRCAVLGASAEAAALTESTGPRTSSCHCEHDAPPVAFVFPGQGAQYPNMGRQLYEHEPRFRASIDACATTLQPVLGCDLRTLLFPDEEHVEHARASLNDTLYTQPAIFTLSYSLALLFQHWGVRPGAMCGHSIGEFVAATIAGVMERDDALRLVATRGRLMHDLPAGAMLAVRLPLEKLMERLPPALDLAAVNAPELCVVAGPHESIESFAAQLSADGVVGRKLHTSHAFHSSMMEPALEPFLRAARLVQLSPPRTPYVSTVTGDWIKTSEATSPEYWAHHLRAPVQFSKALQVLLEDAQRVLLELGPRRTSTTLALQHRPENPDRVIAAMPDVSEQGPPDEHASVLLGLGALWLNGCDMDWPAFHEGETRRRATLPTYPFQRKRYWLEPGNTVSFGLGQSPAGRPSPAALSSGASAVSTAAAVTGDEISRAVVALLEELLGHDLNGFDPEARFIALGLDSLLLTQLARAVRTRLGFEVTFRQLSERYSTTKLLTDAIRAAPRAASPAVVVSPTAAPQPVVAPPTPEGAAAEGGTFVPSATGTPSRTSSAGSAQPRRSYVKAMADAARSVATRYKLRSCAAVGADVRVCGRVWIWGGGRITVGQRVLLDASRAPIELHAEEGAEITIGDDAVIEGGTSIEATRAITIGARAHVGMRCKMMDNHFHALDERERRPPAKTVVVEDDAQLGEGVILLPGAHVGRHACVQARSVLGRAVAPGATSGGQFTAASPGESHAE